MERIGISIFHEEMKTIYLLSIVSQAVAVKVMDSDLAQATNEVHLKVREFFGHCLPLSVCRHFDAKWRHGNYTWQLAALSCY
jgi:hypothetical protein